MWYSTIVENNPRRNQFMPQAYQSALTSQGNDYERDNLHD